MVLQEYKHHPKHVRFPVSTEVRLLRKASLVMLSWNKVSTLYQVPLEALGPRHIHHARPIAFEPLLLLFQSVWAVPQFPNRKLEQPSI